MNVSASKGKGRVSKTGGNAGQFFADFLDFGGNIRGDVLRGFIQGRIIAVVRNLTRSVVWKDSVGNKDVAKLTHMEVLIWGGSPIPMPLWGGL